MKKVHFFKLILIAFFLGSTISCSFFQNTSEKPFVLDLDDVVQTAGDQPFFANSDTIVLNPGSQLIPSFDIVKEHHGNFYILDKRQKAIFVFDEAGQLAYQIAREGRGPGEYLNIFDFFLMDGQLHLVTQLGRVLIYDKDLFIAEYDLPFTPMYCEYLGENKVAFQNVYEDFSYKYRLVVYCLERNEIIDSMETEKGVDDDSYPFWRQRHLWPSGNVVLYNNDYSNDVFMITNSGIEHLFSMTGVILHTADEIMEFNNNPTLRQGKNDKVDFLKGLTMHGNVVSFGFLVNYLPYTVFLNLDDNTYKSFKAIRPPYFAATAQGAYGFWPRMAPRPGQPMVIINYTFEPHLLD